MEPITLEYVWIGAQNELRSKTRTVRLESIHGLSFDQLNDQLLQKIPGWDFDGSSTGQAVGSDSEVLLQPCCLCWDPFRQQGLIVLSDCYLVQAGQLVPHPTNTRHVAAQVLRRLAEEHPWFGLEQEYVLTSLEGRPLGWPKYTSPPAQGKYYCGTGADRVFARRIIEEHYQACLKVGLTISGYNAEVMPGQYEFQIGPVEGIRAADQLILSRYLLERVAELHGVLVNYSPKPIEGDWNGSGLHHNYSTEKMRAEGGLAEIMVAIGRLEQKHREHLAVYGVGNEARLTGRLETSSMDRFSYGVGTRNTSVRIPNTTQLEGRGYLEDRRISANADPYLTTSIVAQTCAGL